MASNYINLVDAESDDAEIQFIGRRQPSPISISSDEESPPVLPPRKPAKVRDNRTSLARPTPASTSVQVKVEPGARPSSSVHTTASNPPLKRSGSQDIEMVDAHLSSTSEGPSSSDTDEFWEDSYTIDDALNEYPALNEEEVHQRVAQGGIETPHDIYHKIILPKIKIEGIKERDRLDRTLQALAKKLRPPSNIRTQLIPQNPRPPQKPSQLADPNRNAHPAIRMFRNTPLSEYNIVGRRQPRDMFKDWTCLRLVHRSRTAPGAINQISQSERVIAIGSSTFEGHNHDPPSVYNRGPSLMFWREGFNTTSINGHYRRFVDGEPTVQDVDDNSDDGLKYYTVNDVKFDPQNSKRAVSCASDNRIFIWDFEADDENFDVRKVGQLPLDTAPQELHYRSDSILGVVGYDGSIYVYKHADMESAQPLRLSPSEHIGIPTFVWGEGFTYNYLFASRQPTEGHSPNPGYHKAYDIRNGKCAFRFSESTDPGSSIAISPDGQRVALSTYGAHGHKIRLYDVRSRCSRSISIVSVDGYDNIEHMEFDPYGDYVAAGRTDNFVQILDSRTNKIIHNFYHARSIAGPGEEKYGITGLRWITGWEGKGLRLFTGGDDGCVRIWNPQTTARDFRDSDSQPFLYGVDPLNGFEVAREMYPIGHFAIGKAGKWDSREMALVVRMPEGIKEVTYQSTTGGVYHIFQPR